MSNIFDATEEYIQGFEQGRIKERAKIIKKLRKISKKYLKDAELPGESTFLPSPQHWMAEELEKCAYKLEIKG